MKNLITEFNNLKNDVAERLAYKNDFRIECGDNVYQRVCENATVEDFELFVKQLKDENKGARFFEREVVGNKFFGVQLEEGYVYVLYFDCVKELRIQYKRRQVLYNLRNLEKRGKELAKLGYTYDNIEDLMLGSDIEDDYAE
jgi:hypothetical protein